MAGAVLLAYFFIPTGVHPASSLMSLQVLEAQTGENPVATVLILHGLGADGRDFLPVAEQLDLSSVGPVRFIFPNAPVMP